MSQPASSQPTTLARSIPKSQQQNPAECNPNTSLICAEELSVSEGETAQAPAPPLLKQPADPPAPAASSMPAQQALQPPAPPVPEDIVSSGGALVPREPIPGAGVTFADCMAIWEPATHMSKSEWRTTCVRTLNGISLLPSDVASPSGGTHKSEPSPARHARQEHKGAKPPHGGDNAHS
jgi:hypothetical protein